MQKKENIYFQILRNLTINYAQVPQTAINVECAYQGRICNLSMDNTTAKAVIQQNLTRTLTVKSALIHIQLLFQIKVRLCKYMG